MKSIKYLTPKDVLLLHNMVIDAAGGSHGIRDVGLLESAVIRPQASFGGQDLYPGILDKAAALVHSLLMNHMFVDGNKRTAMYSCMTFLELNDYKFTATNKQVVNFAIRIENDKLSLEEIVKWLKEHTKKA